MNENLALRLAELPMLLGNHMLLSVVALAVGTAISVPLGILAAREARWRTPVLTVASVIQTIPGLALLALMVPLLGGTIGFLPAFIALVLYSVLPTLRNTVTGITGVDPALVEAATGMGMTSGQILTRVQLPLAAPTIIAGVRTATVWVVGIATLSTPVGAPSLGNYIFMGLQTRNHVATLLGCISAALLAIVLDQVIRLIEVAARRRSRRLAVTSSAILAGIVLMGLLAPLINLSPSPTPAAAPVDTEVIAHAPDAPTRTLVVGSKPFTEQYVLANLIGDQLAAAGFDVDRKPNLGSTVLFDALTAGTVDVYVDYSGTIWATLMKRGEAKDPETVLIEMAAYLLREHGVVCLGPLGFENAYALAMRRSEADALKIQSIADLARHAPKMKIGGDYEFFGRSEWAGLTRTYGLTFDAQVGLDSTFMYTAVKEGEVNVISAYSSDGRILAFDLKVLDDPKQALPPYDAVLLLSPRAARDRRLVETLKPLIGAIRDDDMRWANKQVDLDAQSPEAAARALQDRIAR